MMAPDDFEGRDYANAADGDYRSLRDYLAQHRCDTGEATSTDGGRTWECSACGRPLLRRALVRPEWIRRARESRLPVKVER